MGKSAKLLKAKSREGGYRKGLDVQRKQCGDGEEWRERCGGCRWLTCSRRGRASEITECRRVENGIQVRGYIVGGEEIAVVLRHPLGDTG